MKYMIVQAGEREIPLLFAEEIFHLDIAKLFDNKVISAGFVSRERGGMLECYGGSESLEINSRPVDATLINVELEPFDWRKLFEENKARARA